MRLIDADKLREIYSDKIPVILERYGFRTGMGILLGAIKLLDEQPTVDCSSIVDCNFSNIKNKGD